MHKKYGNKWADIAAHLSGRYIKNIKFTILKLILKMTTILYNFHLFILEQITQLKIISIRL